MIRNQGVHERPEGATGPEDLDVMPRRWAWHKHTGELIAVMPSIEYEKAHCVNREDLFLAEGTQQAKARVTQEAKAICADCPIRKQCAAWALAHEDFGVWGGMTATERRVERKRIGLRLMDPIEAGTYGLGDDPYEKAPEQCKNGHYLKFEYDMVKDHARSTRYRDVYRVACSTCYHERFESEEGREKQRQKGHRAQAALVRNGTRNTPRANKFGA